MTREEYERASRDFEDLIERLRGDRSPEGADRVGFLVTYGFVMAALANKTKTVGAVRDIERHMKDEIGQTCQVAAGGLN